MGENKFYDIINVSCDDGILKKGIIIPLKDYEAYKKIKIRNATNSKKYYTKNQRTILIKKQELNKLKLREQAINKLNNGHRVFFATIDKYNIQYDEVKKIYY